MNVTGLPSDPTSSDPELVDPVFTDPVSSEPKLADPKFREPKSSDPVPPGVTGVSVESSVRSTLQFGVILPFCEEFPASTGIPITKATLALWPGARRTEFNWVPGVAALPVAVSGLPVTPCTSTRRKASMPSLIS